MKLGPRQLALVETLASGKYKQGKQMLRSVDNKYCCLGVACDIYDSSRWSKLFTRTCTMYRFSGETCSLPVEVEDWFGFFSATGVAGPESHACEPSLANLNDAGVSHPKIAAKLRANPGKYFKESL